MTTQSYVARRFRTIRRPINRPVVSVMGAAGRVRYPSMGVLKVGVSEMVVAVGPGGGGGGGYVGDRIIHITAGPVHRP